jgi:hypothetical protein
MILFITTAVETSNTTSLRFLNAVVLTAEFIYYSAEWEGKMIIVLRLVRD